MIQGLAASGMRYHLPHVRPSDTRLGEALRALSGRGYSATTTFPTPFGRCASRCSMPTWRCRWSRVLPRRSRPRGRRRGHQEPDARPGVHQDRARGTGPAHGRAEHGPQSARAAPRRGDARRPSGCGQDHDGRQARALADREAAQKSAAWSAPTCTGRRPSQLQTLAAQVGAGFAPRARERSAGAIAKRALTEATLQAYDVLLIDTAGACTSMPK
jgi:hypothetical protein